MKMLTPQEDRDALYAEVTNWVAEQKAAGKTVTNDEAPCWPAYQLAERFLALSEKRQPVQLDAKADTMTVTTVTKDLLRLDEIVDKGETKVSGGEK